MLAIIVASAAYYFVDGFLNPPAPQVVEKKPPKPEPWDGKAKKTINASVSLRGTSFTIYQNLFVGLQSPKTNVAIVLASKPIRGNQAPLWMRKASSFKGFVPSLQSFLPVMSPPRFKQDDGLVYVNVNFVQVPTASLGETCDGERLAPFTVSFLGIPKNKRLFSTEISAPPPPKGSCLSKEGPLKIKPKVVLKRINPQSQGNSSIVTVSGTANLPGKTLIISVGTQPKKVARVQTNKAWSARFRISRPKGPVFVRVGTKKNPGLAFRKTVLVKP